MSQACLAISMTCLCLATIDQYLATSSSVYFQRLCNIKLARRLIIIAVLIWLLHGIAYLLYFDHIQLSTTNKTTCTGITSTLNYYRNNVFTICIIGYFPSVIAAIFCTLSPFDKIQIQLTLNITLIISYLFFAVCIRHFWIIDCVLYDHFNFEFVLSLYLFVKTFSSTVYLYNTLNFC